MVLSHLSLHHFRNLGVQELTIPEGGVALVGENAQGKTNLLESIYYLETFRSFRGARDDQLLAFGEPVFRVEARLEGNAGADPVSVAAAFQRQGRKKRVTVNGVEPDRMGDGLGRVGAILFSPADVGLVSDGPAERRRFLDILLSLNVPGYLQTLQRFRHVLAQRNAALRDGSPGPLIRVWDGPLSEAGASVSAQRRLWVERRSNGFAAYYGAVSGRGAATLTFRGSVPGPDGVPVKEDSGPEIEVDLRVGYLQALEEGLDRDRRMGTTLVGPQRDEMVIRLEGEGKGLDVREYGSGGQRRTAALALRLVEGDTIRDARGVDPIILLDDVFAELDEGRSRRILDVLEGSGIGQVILTAPRESDVRIRRDSLPRWGIHEGVITQ